MLKRLETETPVSKAHPSDTGERGGNRRVWLSRILLAVAVGLAVTLLWRTLSRYHPDEILDSIRAVPLPRLFVAIGWASASYLCLTLNDWLALRYVGRPLPYPYAALTSFVALAFGHNIGFAALSSGAIRYRFYSRQGLSGETLVKIIVFCGTTIFLGMFVLGDLALLLRPDFAQRMTGLSREATYWLGGALLVLPIGYLGIACLPRRAYRILRWSVEIPDIGIALAQIVVGCLNFTFVAACLHAVVSAIAEVGYFEVLAAFVIANAATIVTHAPGGLGVIETVVMLLLRRPELIGAVLVFRFVYYLLPLGLGAISLALAEARWRAK